MDDNECIELFILSFTSSSYNKDHNNEMLEKLGL